MTNRIDEIKEHLEEMKRTPNPIPGYAFAVADIQYLLEELRIRDTVIIMQVEMLQKAKRVIEAVKECKQYLRESTAVTDDLVYRTPAQQLRQEAKQMYIKDRAIRNLDTALSEWEKE